MLKVHRWIHPCLTALSSLGSVFRRKLALLVSTTQHISTHSVVVSIAPQKVSLIPLAVMQHWSRVVAWTLCNRLPRATNVCRLPALRETPQRHRGHPCGDGFCGGYSYSLQSRICGLQVWMGCASMLCDELCEGEVLRFGVLCPDFSPRETWRFHEAWSIPDIYIESIPMICLIHSRKTRYLKRTQCLSQWFFPQWPVTSSGFKATFRLWLRIHIKQPGFNGSFKTCRRCYFSEFQVFQESCFMPPNFQLYGSLLNKHYGGSTDLP